MVVSLTRISRFTAKRRRPGWPNPHLAKLTELRDPQLMWEDVGAPSRLRVGRERVWYRRRATELRELAAVHRDSCTFTVFPPRTRRTRPQRPTCCARRPITSHPCRFKLREWALATRDGQCVVLPRFLTPAAARLSSFGRSGARLIGIDLSQERVSVRRPRRPPTRRRPRLGATPASNGRSRRRPTTTPTCRPPTQLVICSSTPLSSKTASPDLS